MSKVMQKNSKMLKGKLTRRGDGAVDVVQSSKNEGRYEMLFSLIDDPRITMRFNNEVAEVLKCFLAGKWLWDDDGVADLYTSKLFDPPISEWHPHTVECYTALYDARYNDYAHFDAEQKAKRKKSALKTLAVAGGAACAVIAALVAVSSLRK